MFWGIPDLNRDPDPSSKQTKVSKCQGSTTLVKNEQLKKKTHLLEKRKECWLPHSHHSKLCNNILCICDLHSATYRFMIIFSVADPKHSFETGFLCDRMVGSIGAEEFSQIQCQFNADPCGYRCGCGSATLLYCRW
jgi:hypothetical protein